MTTTVEARQAGRTKMQLTAGLGADFWNDSCAIGELSEAVANGAVGATSNPVIVYNAVQGESERWLPLLDRIIREAPADTEDEIAWKLVGAIGQEAAALLEPVYQRTRGKKGFLSMQVNPKFYRSRDKMVAHARGLAAVAPNVAIKIPATAVGIAAMEEIVAAGINVNATVSFSVSQALAAAEAFEQGLRRAEKSGVDMEALHPYATLMVGRIDDHLKRVMQRERVAIDPGYIEWAGIAVFKRAHRLFQERGFRATLLAAAYRNVMQWTELIGDNVILTMPYQWWKQFNASDVTPAKNLERAVDPEILTALERRFDDFRKAYDPSGLAPEGFVSYGPSTHTLHQFLEGYEKLLRLVRDRMLG